MVLLPISSWTTYDSSDEDEEVLNNIQLVARNTADPKSWCSCSQCATMETGKECVCCHELESADFLEIKGKAKQCSGVFLFVYCVLMQIVT